uniref:Uncharacterized protein TCIL3000_11_15710 n=1 Tax=Trypanosoma congolense (strain IL3000) TaxID=1068625 RepID=G0V338_TRYCI|nr:unnamed protein product [Trypanosoma congolense IL3000]
MKGGSSVSRVSTQGDNDVRDGADWRIHNNKPLIAVCMLTGIVVLAVHWRSISITRTDISLPHIMGSMQLKCRSIGEAFNSTSKDNVLHPVPTQFGVSVWVEREDWSVLVHDTLDRVEEALSTVEDRKQRFVQRIVRVSPPNAESSSRRVSSNSNKVSEDPLATAATKQQLGLGVARHAYALNLHEELLMHAVSFFAVSEPDGKSVRCFLFDERRAYCTVPNNAAPDVIKREIPAAIGTLMAGWMEIDNFHSVDAKNRWAATRNARSCHYALRALKQLKMSVDAHSEMPIPEGVNGAVVRLQTLINEGKFAQLARAADDLQFHQLLLPQIYIPWDQALVNHLSILMPIYGVVTLGVKLIKEAHQSKYEMTFI